MGQSFGEGFNWGWSQVSKDFSSDGNISAPQALPPPPEPAKLDDEAIAKAKKRSLLEQSMAQGRKSTFLSGANGAADMPVTGKPTLGA